MNWYFGVNSVEKTYIEDWILYKARNEICDQILMWWCSNNCSSVEFSGIEVSTRLKHSTTVHEIGNGPRSTKNL